MCAHDGPWNAYGSVDSRTAVHKPGSGRRSKTETIAMHGEQQCLLMARAAGGLDDVFVAGHLCNDPRQAAAPLRQSSPWP